MLCIAFILALIMFKFINYVFKNFLIISMKRKTWEKSIPWKIDTFYSIHFIVDIVNVSAKSIVQSNPTFCQEKYTSINTHWNLIEAINHLILRKITSPTC